MPQLKLKTRLHREDIKGDWTYLVVRDASKIFGLKTNISVRGTIDNHPIEGTLQLHGDGSHRFPVNKKFRDAIGKSIGEMVDVLFENFTESISGNAKKNTSGNKKPSTETIKKKKKFFSRKKS